MYRFLMYDIRCLYFYELRRCKTGSPAAMPNLDSKSHLGYLMVGNLHELKINVSYGTIWGNLSQPYLAASLKPTRL